LSVTPMSMAVMISTVANGGTRVVPRLVTAVDEGDGWQDVPPPANPFPPLLMKPETVSAVHDGLWLAVNGAGTGRRARIAGRDVAGKTGTTQVISHQGRARAGGSTRDLRDHGWFVFFAPRDNPEVAGVVFAEHSDSSSLAVQIARHILETYFAQRDGLPLPLLTAPPAARPAPAVPAPSPAATRPTAPAAEFEP